jgi:diguanylate cyclase (GGDEF)-like protein
VRIGKVLASPLERVIEIDDATILAVDDSPDTGVMLRYLLESVGCSRVLVAGSAREALALLGVGPASGETTGEGTTVDAILMDVRMPEMSGIEACRRLKAVERLRDVPVLMLTALTDEADLQAALAAGATDYITKPVNPVVLVARLRAALLLKRELDARRAREKELVLVTQQLQQANLELHRLSRLDGLTGLANRRDLDETLALEWARACREGMPLSLVMVDIDHFKAYNDSRGHQSGDECLRAVAQVVKAATRRPGDCAARYGGEEFAVILPNTPPAGSRAFAERLRLGVEGLGMPHGRSPIHACVTISAGVATSNPEPPLGTHHSLVAAADAALYTAKLAGRNQVRGYEPASSGGRRPRQASQSSTS